MIEPAPFASRVSRYTQAAFPPYRFIPGLHPHPTAHPDGHSFRAPGERHDAVTFVPPERWRQSHDYLYGADLYNHGYWWEAHEAWEGLWQLTDKKGVQGQFLQGLIQTSAVHLKFQQRHERGFERLRSTSRAYFDFVIGRTNGGQFMGLAAPAFLASVDAYYASIEWGGIHDADRYPYVMLMALR